MSKTHNQVKINEVDDHINDEEVVVRDANEVVADQLLTRITALTSTSARIRALHKTGMTNSGIVSYLNTYFKSADRPHPYRYQHVRNVLTQVVKKAD
jgi:hypothetical protein